MKLIIKGTLMALNEYSRLGVHKKGKGKNGYYSKRNQAKNEQQELIEWYIKMGRLDPITKGIKVVVKFHWFEPDRRRDPDNICFAKKFIMDSLVKQGILQDDSWKYVKGFVDCFSVDREDPRIEVELMEVP